MARRKIDISDIQFKDERLNRLVQGVRRIADEMKAVQRILEEGAEGTVLTKLSGRDYDIDWIDAGGAAGVGEANTGANAGSGAGVFKDKTGVQLNFRSIRGEGDITVEVDGDELVISGSASALTGETLDALVVAGAFS